MWMPPPPEKKFEEKGEEIGAVVFQTPLNDR